MSKSAKKAFTGIGLLCFSVQLVLAQTSPDNYVARSRQFFRTLYPDLDRLLRPVVVDSNRLRDPDAMDPDLMNTFAMALYAERASTKDIPACWCSSPVLSATFAYDWRTRNKELFIMSATGPVVDARRDKFVADMSSHPESSDAQIVSALNASAKFGPGRKNEFLRALPIQDLKPFVGELKVTAVDFFVRDGGGEGRASALNPQWVVTANLRTPDGKEQHYTLAFEPFEGRIKLIMRVP